MSKYFDNITIVNEKNEPELFQITVNQEGNFIKVKAKYCGKQEVKISKALLSKFKHNRSGDTPIYAEAYSKLSQTIGTLGNPKHLTPYSDVGHYKLPEKEGYFTAYNMLILLEEPYMMIGYSSSERFVGQIHFNDTEIILEQDLGGIVIQPNEEIVLEEIMLCTGRDRESLLEMLGDRLNHNHPMLGFDPIPIGWCSWYFYGPEVTQDDIYDNMDAIQANIPELKYIQIDDGYQANMGDYLTPAEDFKHLPILIKRIKDEGFEPAIWVAPFIAEADSVLFKEHPEYFVKGEDNRPLASDKVSFGGWRRGPWYMLDGTHPGAREHLKNIFAVMNKEWGINYFKLDANMWGAMPFGKHYDQTKTYVQAYRMGMQAILEGAGEDSYILGCNAPVWPSIGLVHGMRITGDIFREWQIADVLAKECFYRNWQHKRLWINDPDCVVLDNVKQTLIGPDGMLREIGSALTEAEFSYHRAHIVASGGALLSGDAINKLDQEHIDQLKRFLPLPDQAAQFDDDTFTVGRQTRGKENIITVFNREDDEKAVKIDLRGRYEVKDYWDDHSYGENRTDITLVLEPHSGKVLKCSIK